MTLSDLGSLASILGLILSFIAGFSICKITIKKTSQENKSINIFSNKNTNNQKNNNIQ